MSLLTHSKIQSLSSMVFQYFGGRLNDRLLHNVCNMVVGGGCGVWTYRGTHFYAISNKCNQFYVHCFTYIDIHLFTEG